MLSLRRCGLAAAGLLLVSCLGGNSTAPGESLEGDSPVASDGESGEDGARGETPGAATRVLVTGFNDWRELGDPPNLWRCRDNPSCRLLLGEPQDSEPTDFGGPLVSRLRAGAPEVQWSFSTLPVTWGAFADVPVQDFEIIVNVGLGIYDRFDTLQLESGAYNLRRGRDAAGVERGEPIASGEAVLVAPGAVTERLSALAGQQIAGYEIVVAQAREGNSYLCNETHFRALSALLDLLERGEAGPRAPLREVYFLHIPYAEDGDYEALAAGVAGLLTKLVSP